MASSVDALLNQVRYTNRARVKEDMTKLLDVIRTLRPKVASLTQNNGVTTKLLVLNGTIPIYYQSVQYNIPIELFVMEAYPKEPPKLYVRPTSNMTVKSNHRHVDMQGLVYLPYLHEWKATDNLVKLVETASGIFSIDPPLFSKPAAAAVAAAAAATTATADIAAPIHLQQYNAIQTVQVNGGGAVEQSSSDTFNESFVSGPHDATVVSRSNHNNNKNGVRSSKAELVEEVTMKLYEGLTLQQTNLKNDINTEFNTEQYLTDSHETALVSIQVITAKTDDYKLALDHMDKKLEELKLWEAEAKQKPVVDVEEKFVPSDELSAQIIKLHAQLNAIEDAFYHLERALVSAENKTVDLAIFLKQVRKLAERQFKCRAHLMKINAFCELSS